MMCYYLNVHFQGQRVKISVSVVTTKLITIQLKDWPLQFKEPWIAEN